MKISKNIQAAWKEMIVEAIDKQELKNNVEYEQLNIKYNELWHKLKDSIPKEASGLLSELDSVSNSMETIAQEELYKKGFKDGVQVVGVLKEFAN